MIMPLDRGSVARWLFVVMVGLLALGHVCDLSAFAPVDSHHAADHHGDAQIGSCDTVPATSTPGPPTMWTALDLGPIVADVEPTRSVVRRVEESATLADRPPLFLLHAALLI